MACPVTVSRAEWDAAPASNRLENRAEYFQSHQLPLKYMAFTDTTPVRRHLKAHPCYDFATCKTGVRDTQDYHMGPLNNFADIGYHFVIGGNGQIFEGRSWGTIGAFDTRLNRKAYAVAFIGSYPNGTDAMPSPAALAAANSVIECAVSDGHLEQNYTLVPTIWNPINPRIVDTLDHFVTVQPNRKTNPPKIASIGTLTPSILSATTAYPSQPPMEVIIPASIISLLILLALAIFGLFRLKKCRHKKRFQEHVCSEVGTRLLSHLVTRFKIARGSVHISDEVIGCGNFGEIRKGCVVQQGQLSNTSQFCHVAVKRLQPGDGEALKNLISEMEILTKVGRHVNIVNLVGIVLEDELMIVLEYCSLGSLETFLRNNNNLMLLAPSEPKCQDDLVGFSLHEFCQKSHDPEIRFDMVDLVNWSFQISRGMKFISSQPIIHRDLATRNMLLDGMKTVKIADFGMAREEIPYVLKRENVPLPLRWLAPESMTPHKGIYTVESDVWSFGVVMWEIFSLARLPFDIQFPEGMNYQQLCEFLASGCRLEQPVHCSNEIFTIMKECWEWKSEDRPTFSQLVLRLGELLPVGMKEQYVNFDAENQKFNLSLNRK